MNAARACYRCVIVGQMRRLLAAALAAATLTLTLSPAAAHASAAAESPGGRALDWAEANYTGHWYLYGGIWPDPDCSGLVMESVLRADSITLPRTTYGMLSSPRLHQIPLAGIQRGDLLFYGSGHVEFATAWYHVSFGAHDTGSRAGWITWGWGWQPTMAFRLR